VVSFRDSVLSLQYIAGMCVTVTGMALALKYYERRNVGGEGLRGRHLVGRFPGCFEIVRLIRIHEVHYILQSVPRSKHSVVKSSQCCMGK